MDPHICWPANIAPARASHPAALLTNRWESVWVFLELYFSYIYEFELTQLVLAASWHSRKDRARSTHTSPSPLASLFVALYSARNKLLFLETPTGKCWALYGGHSRLSLILAQSPHQGILEAWKCSWGQWWGWKNREVKKLDLSHLLMLAKQSFRVCLLPSITLLISGRHQPH